MKVKIKLTERQMYVNFAYGIVRNEKIC